jgi:RHS repeat-associated protein
VTTTFTWDANAGLPVVLDDGNQYVYGAGLAEMVTGSGTYYYLADGLGSTMAIVDTSGTVQKSYTYDVYGKPTATGTLANAYDFAGQETDPSTGLQYLRARYMDPATGVFLSRDPMAGRLYDPRTQQPYCYAAANPVVLVDPSGESWGGPSDPHKCDTLRDQINVKKREVEKRRSQYEADANNEAKNNPKLRKQHKEQLKIAISVLGEYLNRWDDDHCKGRSKTAVDPPDIQGARDEARKPVDKPISIWDQFWDNPAIWTFVL